MALSAAKHYPSKFRRLALIETQIYFADDPPLVRQKNANRRTTIMSFDEARSRYRLLPLQPNPPAFLLEHVAEHSIRETSDGWVWKFDPNLMIDRTVPLAEQLLPEISAHVHYFYGQHSSLVSRYRAERVIHCLPRANAPICVEHAHHHVMLDQPLCLARHLRRILSTSNISS